MAAPTNCAKIILVIIGGADIFDVIEEKDDILHQGIGPLKSPGRHSHAQSSTFEISAVRIKGKFLIVIVIHDEIAFLIGIENILAEITVPGTRPARIDLSSSILSGQKWRPGQTPVAHGNLILNRSWQNPEMAGKCPPFTRRVPCLRYLDLWDLGAPAVGFGKDMHQIAIHDLSPSPPTLIMDCPK